MSLYRRADADAVSKAVDHDVGSQLYNRSGITAFKNIRAIVIQILPQTSPINLSGGDMKVEFNSYKRSIVVFSITMKEIGVQTAFTAHVQVHPQ